MASVSADVRRKQNGDLQRPAFGQDLSKLLEDLGELTSLPWRTRAELLEAVSSQTYRALHDDLSRLGFRV